MNVDFLNREDIYSVSELTQAIHFILEEEFSSVWVSGEISNYKVPGSGHAYFVLKDNKSQIKCVIFRRQKRLLNFTPEDGMEVAVRGRLSVYEPRGEYQVIIEHIEPKGIGALQIAFERLKQKLLKEGLFDNDKKQPLPIFPRKIAVVTSPTGAAVRDIIKTITRRFPCIHLLVYPVKVQGEGAAEEIAEGIKELNRLTGIDVMIIGRGGGSLEDLWAFNEEIVARAIYESNIPVISAVGHEIDFTISDFAADVRASTPSSAAEIVVPDCEQIKENIYIIIQRLKNSIKNILIRSRERVLSYSQKRVLSDPFARIRDMQQMVDECYISVSANIRRVSRDRKAKAEHLKQVLYLLSPANKITNSKNILVELRKMILIAISGRINVDRNRLSEFAGRLHALSPLGVLDRGYSICQKLPEMKSIRNVEGIKNGDYLRVILSKGKFDCKVTSIPQDHIAKFGHT